MANSLSYNRTLNKSTTNYIDLLSKRIEDECTAKVDTGHLDEYKAGLPPITTTPSTSKLTYPRHVFGTDRVRINYSS